MPEFEFTDYARRWMRRRMIPDAAVHQIVADADRIIRRRDGRTEYFGVWEGRSLLIVAVGDVEADDTILVLNAIEDVRRRR
jgi:hypothetical protein